MPSQTQEAAQTCAPQLSPRLIEAVGDTNAAARLARAWKAPHAGFFALDAPRRNALRLAAFKGAVDAKVAVCASDWALKRLTDTLLAPAPAGFVEALRRLDDAQISLICLRRLAEILSEGGVGAKTLRHLDPVTPGDIERLHALPDGLRRIRILALLPTAGMADLLKRGVKEAVKMADNPIVATTRLAARLERARTSSQLFRMVVEAIGLEVLAPAPIPGTDWFVPINTVPQIRTTALKFRNCLESRIGWMLRGYGAYYEVVGEEPAVVEIVRRPGGGWRLGEALGHANARLSPALFGRIIAYVREHGATDRPHDGMMLAEQLSAAANWT